ncbi:DnaJ-like protein subfamily C member 2 [Aphelenchoides bicaudatus]|nr:DnaJ-like protein subfamily C member 2 [Aphelenchoides bicaudatus]
MLRNFCFIEKHFMRTECKMEDLSKAVAFYRFIQPAPRKIEECGIAYEVNVVLHRLQLGLSGGPAIGDVQGLSKSPSTDSDELCQQSPEDFMDMDEERYFRHVSKLDPNDYKQQDHYKVLGLSKLRYQATMGQIKTAYRQKVLVYHPDKGKATKAGVRNEAIFACIQKAYEQLGLDLDKRRAFDSVDPKFDDSAPEMSDLDENNFFELMAPFFERNSRFSLASPVPQLGDSNSSREEVEKFYDFWFGFKSWREFSYKDAEDKSRGEDRWERREIEKANRVEREQLRKKYVKKLSSTVELAYEKDPRVAFFRESDKKQKQDQKDRKRLEKQKLAEERAAEQRRQQEEIEAKRQRAVEEEKKQAQEKQKVKKQLEAEQKKLRDLYFTDDNAKRLQVMEGVERICLGANFGKLSEIVSKLESVTELADALKKKNQSKHSRLPNQQSRNQTPKQVVWDQDETMLLIKATNMYPAGSVERWAQVTKYINDHSKDSSKKPKVEKDIIKEVKRIKSNEAANILQSTNTYVAPKPTGAVETSNDDAWSATQQKQLETALKSTDAKDPERWDKIAKGR